MAEIEIRQAISTDIPEIISIDHGCDSTHVYQLESRSDNGQYEIVLREVKLPRSLHLSYPRNPNALMDEWTKYNLVLVARSGERLIGYLTLLEEPGFKSARVKDLVVLPQVRRKGIATALILAAQKWIKTRGLTRFVLEVPGKNRAGVELANKLKFEFNGFCDNYYANLEMGLFFVNLLK